MTRRSEGKFHPFDTRDRIGAVQLVTERLAHELPGRSFTASAGMKVAVLPKVGLPLQTQETRLQFYQGLNRSDSFPLLSAPHSLFSICRSEKIPGSPTWRCGEWIWLTGPWGLHRNSTQRLNVSSIRILEHIRDPEIPIILRPHIEIREYKNNNKNWWLIYIFILLAYKGSCLNLLVFLFGLFTARQAITSF